MKRRILSLIVSLFLLGTVSAQHYTVNPHAYDNNMPIVAVIHIDNAVPATGTYEIGAFIGDEVRGSALIQSDLDNTYWMQVYYNTETESSATISFKVYDGTDEMDVTTTLAVNPEGAGTKADPIELEITTTTTATTVMPEGWFWWSSPLELNSDGLSVLENSLGSSGVRIQSKNNGYVDRFDYNGGSYWYGSLQSINNEQMYQIHTSADCSSVMSGVPATPSNHPITINGNAWSWIGFPSNQSMSVATAMSGFTPEANDQIKSKNNGYTTYVVYGSNAVWYGTLNTLVPGQGYMYLSKSGEQKTLTFQSSRENTPANIICENNYFTPKEAMYCDNMTFTAVVDLDGTELRGEEYEVAVFMGDECRGSSKLMYVEPLNRYLAFLLISGDVEETMSFVLTNGSDVFYSNNHYMYKSDGVIGTATEPVVLRFCTSGVNEEGVAFVNVYPNPSTGVFTIEGNGIRKYEIINTFGQVILVKEVDEDNLQLDLGNYANGVYLLRVITNNGISTKQLIKH